MQEFFMMVGLPGSGKSTYAQALQAMYGAVVHSSDSIRQEVLGDASDQTQQDLVFKTLHERVISDLKAGKNVVYDATNIKYQLRRQFVQQVKSLKREDLDSVCVFMAVPYEQCLRNNAGRERRVPDSVIERMYRNIDVPMYLEGWDKIIVRGVERRVAPDDMAWPPPSRYDPDYSLIMKAVARLCTLEHDNPHHSLTVGQHMLTAYAYFLSHYRNLEDDVLTRAILLHDIGKEATKTFHNSKGEPTETAHFYGHERVGAYDSFDCNRDLRAEEQLAVALLIRWHMAPFTVSHSENPGKTEAKLRRLLGEDTWKQIQIINDCDCHAH